MDGIDGVAPKEMKFAGIAMPAGISKANFTFLFINTFLMGMFMTVPSVIQPALMSDVVGIDQSFAGSINSFLQNMSQVATLALVAAVGALSDRLGRKRLVFAGFVMAGACYFMFGNAGAIAARLGIPNGAAGRICAALSFMPGRAAEFAPFAPGLLVSYAARLLIGVALILGYPQLIAMWGDYSSGKDRGKAMAMYGTGVGLAAIIVFGVFGGILRRSGVVSAIMSIVALAAVGGLVALAFQKDHMPEKTAERHRFREILPLLRGSRALRASYICAMVTRADIIVLGTYLVAWGVKAASDSGMAAGTATMLATIPMMIEGGVALVAFPIIGMLTDRWGRVQTILATVLSGGVGMCLLAFAPTPFSPVCFLAAALIGIGQAGSFAGSNALAIDASPKAMMGAVLGGVNTMQPIGVLLFLGLGGYLFDKVSPGSAFLLKGGASLAFLAWFFVARKPIIEEIRK
ncbi:MAG: MFS transporter [Spirochaetes bacterium]|nr:MFS transporter [Spirochaetota bacterium]MBU1081382.1 MFS transporter [Spirochaetota bacterium]